MGIRQTQGGPAGIQGFSARAGIAHERIESDRLVYAMNAFLLLFTLAATVFFLYY
jgi:hypothetical protein